jgi:hypothetical protein
MRASGKGDCAWPLSVQALDKMWIKLLRAELFLLLVQWTCLFQPSHWCFIKHTLGTSEKGREDVLSSPCPMPSPTVILRPWLRPHWFAPSTTVSIVFEACSVKRTQHLRHNAQTLKARAVRVCVDTVIQHTHVSGKVLPLRIIPQVFF